MEKETRAASTQFTVMKGEVSGRAIPFNSPGKVSERGKRYTEIVSPGAPRFYEDVKLYWQHDRRNVLASTRAGTLQIKPDSEGVTFTAQLPESALREREAIARGDVAGVSWQMEIHKDKWEGNTRHLQDILVDELSIVDRPSYAGTSLHIRSEDDVDETYRNNILMLAELETEILKKKCGAVE